MMRNKAARILWASCLAAVTVVVPVSQAYDLPNVNLGYTSFLDGGRLGPGTYYHQYLQYYKADRFTTDGGDTLRLPRPPMGVPEAPELDLWVLIAQVVHQSEREVVLGGMPGIEVSLPYAFAELDPGTYLAPFEEDSSGVGDLTVGPFLQWDRSPLFENGPMITHRLALNVIIPTGDYEDDKEINVGSNVLSFNPYWAATIYWSEKFSTSWRAHYLWNDKNEDPNRAFAPASDTQAGDAFHANFAAAYAVTDSLRLGANGYYLTQLSNSEVNGTEVSGRKEEVLAVGPGAVVEVDESTYVMLNYYFEADAQNRTEGNRANVQFMKRF